MEVYIVNTGMYDMYGIAYATTNLEEAIKYSYSILYEDKYYSGFSCLECWKRDNLIWDYYKKDTVYVLTFEGFRKEVLSYIEKQK